MRRGFCLLKQAGGASLILDSEERFVALRKTRTSKKKKKLGIVKYDLKHRRIYLVGEVVCGMPRLVENAINLMQKKNSRARIGVYLSSKGGLYPECLEIYQIIWNSQTRIDIIAVDKAFSGAFLILQAGKRRMAFPEAIMRFHKAEGMPDLENTKIDAVQRLIFTARSRPVGKVLQLFHKEAEITAYDARRLRLIDQILDPKILKPLD